MEKKRKRFVLELDCEPSNCEDCIFSIKKENNSCICNEGALRRLGINCSDFNLGTVKLMELK